MPALDERLFQEMLAAAYVVQQHNDALRVPTAAIKAMSDSSTSSTYSARQSKSPGSNAEALPSSCRVCGRPFGAEDVFCGNCSMPRSAVPPSEDLQSKWASLWYMQQAQESAQSRPSQSPDRSSQQTSSHLQSQEIPQETATAPSSPAGGSGLETSGARLWQNSPPTSVAGIVHDVGANAHRQVTASETPDRTSLNATSENPFPVADAKRESAAVPQSGLPQHTGRAVSQRVRGPFLTWALRATGLLVLLAILAVWPSPKNAQLTLFQSLLVKLGLADVPARPMVVKSNPNVNVWVDVHTALYYCEGSDLYGKTPGGHFATQRDALQDEFEPAERVPCQ